MWSLKRDKPNDSRRNIIFNRSNLIFILFCIILEVFLSKFFIHPFIDSYDIATIYCAGKAFFVGANPYDLSVISDKSICDTGLPDKLNPFAYPPWSIPLLSLLSLASYQIILKLIYLFGFTSLVISLLLVSEISKNEVSILHKILTFVIVRLSLPYTFFTVSKQIAFIPMLGISLFFYAYKRRNSYLAGIAIFFIFLKPHLVLFLLPIILALCLTKPSFKALLVCSFLFTSSLLIVYSYIPNFIDTWALRLASDGNIVIASSIAFEFLYIFDLLQYRSLFWAISISIFILVMIFAFYYQKIIIKPNNYNFVCNISFLLVILSMSIALYISPYDFLILLPFVALLLFQSEDRFPLLFSLVLLVNYLGIESIRHSIRYSQFFWFPLLIGLICYQEIKKGLKITSTAD